MRRGQADGQRYRPRYGFVILTSRCIDCKACTVACRAENEVPIGFSRNWVQDSGVVGIFPDLHESFAPGNCMHCDDPPCVQVCPTGASYQREDGIVLIDQERCVGCKYCLIACPYGARFIHPEKGVADKCTACAHRVDRGEAPACVVTCLGKARHFGDLNDPGSGVSRLLARYPSRQMLPEAGTGPAVYYIDVPVPDVDRVVEGRDRGEHRLA